MPNNTLLPDQSTVREETNRTQLGQLSSDLGSPYGSTLPVPTSAQMQMDRNESEQIKVPTEPVQVLSADYTEQFTTNETFKSREEAIEWVKKKGKANQMCIVIRRVIKSDATTLGRTWMYCEREG